jgi:hypothetical protein
VTRAKGTLANIILQGTVEGNRKSGRPKRIWMDDVKDWTGRKTGDLIHLAEERTTWCHIVNSAGSPQWPHGCGTWWWWWWILFNLVYWSLTRVNSQANVDNSWMWTTDRRGWIYRTILLPVVLTCS